MPNVKIQMSNEVRNPNAKGEDGQKVQGERVKQGVGGRLLG